MSAEPLGPPDARLRDALDELQGMIRECYPDATFEISRGTDSPEAIHLTAIVDVDDTEAVVDLVIDRMMELQIEEGLPIFVIPTRPPERALEELRRPIQRIAHPGDVVEPSS